MSEQPVTENTVETTEAAEVTQPAVEIPTDPFTTSGRAQFSVFAEQANALHARVQAAENVNATIAEVRNTSDDPRIVAFREWKAQADAAILAKENEIDAIIKAELVSVEPIDLEKIKAEHKSIVTKARDLEKALKSVVGEAAVVNLPTLKSLSGRAVSASGGSGGKRPRIQSIVVDGVEVYEEVEDKDKAGNKLGTKSHVASFTVLARWMGSKEQTGVKVDVSSLQQACFAAAKTDDLSSLDGKPVSFPYTVSVEKEGKTEYLKTYKEIVITPRVAE